MSTVNKWSDRSNKSTSVRCSRGKNFECRCPRCRQPDDCRAVDCPKRCGALVHPTGNTATHCACPACGSLTVKEKTKILQAEQSIAFRLDDLEAAAKGGALHSVSPTALEKLFDETVNRLSGKHFLACKILQVLSTVCASHALHLPTLAEMMPGMKHPLGRPCDLRKQAAQATLRHILICQCNAAGCPKGATCGLLHDPVPELFTEVFHASMDLMTVHKQGAHVPVEKLGLGQMSIFVFACVFWLCRSLVGGGDGKPLGMP